ncbi:hypothetical protein EUX98_g5725 [Antrodiella citrinella]|uniref:Uncharacterized protein n=1 Tax=Antrodiella citrinella TaxID=2447956 RepID=A0A4S4MR24_9APHY|nr:hypothetical protein EUX98_g5725 [Antrodiella citrinella]
MKIPKNCAATSSNPPPVTAAPADENTLVHSESVKKGKRKAPAASPSPSSRSTPADSSHAAPIPSNDENALDDPDQWKVELLMNVRTTILANQNSIYLGSSAVSPTNFHWVAHGGSTKLLCKTGSTESAVFSIICCIHPSSYVAPDAHWRASNRFNSKFEKAKLSFILCKPPGFPDFTRDFDQAYNLLANIITAAHTPSVSKHDGVLHPISDSEIGLQARHLIFRPESSLAEGTVNPSELSDEFTIDGYPLDDNIDAADAMRALDRRTKQRLEINPLTAYDDEGHTLLPSDYTDSLPNAVVALSFVLSKNFIATNEKKDVFTADVSHIRIVLPPYDVEPIIPPLKHIPIAAKDNFIGDIHRPVKHLRTE